MKRRGPERLDKARALLEKGLPAQALKALSGGAWPAVLAAERDFLAAEAWRARGFFLKAERLYRRGLAGLRPAEDPILWCEAALGSAAGLRSLGRTREARQRLQAARRIRLAGYAWRLRLESALADRAEGLWARSLKELSALLRQARRERAWQEAGFILWAMGGALRFQGRLRRSYGAFQDAARLFRRCGDPVGGGYARFGLGGVSRMMGRLRESAVHYGAAARAFEPTQDIFGRAYAQCGLANALRQLGLLQEAERRYRRSRRLYSLLEDWVDLAYVEWGLGKVRLQRGKLDEARASLETALKRFRSHGEIRGEVLATLALAQALHAMGRTARAEALFKNGYGLARKRGLRAHLEVFT